MTITIIATLIIIGFLFLVVEFFLVPGFSVPGLAGIAMIGYGIYRASSEYGLTGIVTTVSVSVVAVIILIKTAIKSRAVKSIGLDYSEKGNTAVEDYSLLLSKNGKALSDLRPAGTALIEGERFHVVTDGEYIEENSDIIVKEIEGTRILVTLFERR